MLLASTQVYVNGVLAFNGGVFTAGYDGPSAGYSNPAADVLRIALDTSGLLFTSLEVVTIRVVSEADTGETLDTSYTFTILDTTPPVLLAAEGRDLQRVRVRFNEAVVQLDATVVTDALDPDNWTIDRILDGLIPVAAVVVESVEPVTSFEVDLITDIPLTPSGPYRVTAINLTDLKANAIIAPDNTVTFTGWRPPTPGDRDFDLYRMLPLLNRNEDADILDLQRFIACFQEIVDLQLWDIDRFLDILDPDLAPIEDVELMLLDLGNPFTFDLSDTDKRRLVQVLISIYQLKGTGPGILQTILFFMGIEVTIDAYNADPDALILGESELGVSWSLGPGSSFQRYSFTVTSLHVLTVLQRQQLTAIVDYMKPAHTHFVSLIEPTIPDILDHLELGLSSLGEDWQLH